MNADFIEKIELAYGKMSKGQKRIADYVRANYDKAAFMTASTLGKSAGVSESTVVRFAGSLGYDGYPELQRELQEMLRSRLTTVQRMELAGSLSHVQLLEKVLKTDMENIRVTLNEIDKNAFEETVNAILSAKRVYIMGLRSAGMIASILGYYLDFILDSVRTVNASSYDTFEQLIHIGKNDVFLGISFPRYSKRTVDAMRFASQRGAKCIAITDSGFSPLLELADCHMEIRCDTSSFVDSLVAPLSVANALLAAISQKKKISLGQSLSELEKIWNENHVYVGKK